MTGPLLLVIVPLLVAAQTPARPADELVSTMQNVMDSFARHHHGKFALYG
jgi:hypothetical protein